jgi:nucleoside-diphosphate-sugar epimerase
MKIFITGASGYIGAAVAETFRRAGHDVIGLVRSEAKGKALACREIRPIVGTMENLKDLSSLFRESEVFIHCASEMSKERIALDKSVIETFVNVAKKSYSPKTIIYTSGVWVCGNTGDKLVDETICPNPVKLVAWRPAHESLVLNSANSKIRPIVIRPGTVYGGKGGPIARWFEQATKEGVIKIVGDGSNRWAMVHVNDLADAYLRAAESNLSGEIFNIVDRSRFTVLENVQAIGKTVGIKKEIQTMTQAEGKKAFGDYAECLAIDQHIDARKAVRLLGWTPKFGGFRDSVNIFYNSWKANI